MGLLSLPTANMAQAEPVSVLGAGFTPEPTASRQLAAVAGQIRYLTREAEMQVLSRDRSHLGIRPDSGSWSAAECFGHLTMTTRAFLPAISDAIAEAPKLTTDRRLRTGIFPNLFIWNLSPPYRIRFKVLPQLTPHDVDASTVWTDFVGSQSQLLRTMSSAAGLAIDKVSIKSPVYARIRYNIYAAFRMLAAHQSRHIWQTDQILKGFGNPRVSGTP